MVNNYVPNGGLALIIGDGGISKPSPLPTMINNEKVNACLETQSTTRADIFMKPKTDAQIAAIPNPTPGMAAYSSDSDAIVVRNSSNWAPISGVPSPILYMQTIVTNSQILNLGSALVYVAPAPGVGLYYVVHGFGVALSSGGTIINSQNGIQLIYVSDPDVGPFYQAALMPKDIFGKSVTALPYMDYTLGNPFDGVDVSCLSLNDIINKPLAIFPYGTFSASGGSTKMMVQVWYSIVNANF